MVTVFATISMAQTTGTSSNGGTTSTIAAATSEAKILIPIILTWDNVKLNFGEVVVQNVAALGSVDMYPDNAGVPAFASWVNSTASGSGAAPTCPKFTVSGSISTAYTITLPVSSTLDRTVAGTTPLTLDNFKAMNYSTLSANNSISTTLDATGADSFWVGAKLNFDAAVESGIYQGTYQVVVDYN